MRYRKGTALLITTALIASISITGCGKKDSAAVRVFGSTTMEPLTSKLALLYGEKSGVEIKISANGSHTGISALIDGRCDIAESSTRITKAELASARARGLAIREFVIARGMIVPIVHRTNPLRTISLNDLRRIYAGSLRDWGELGWNGKVEAVGRDAFSGTHDVWNTIVLNGAGAAADVKGMPSTTMVLAHVVKNERSIGYVEYAYLNPDVRALQVDGADAASLHEGKRVRYPLVRELYYYVDEARFSGEIKKFIVFALSREGQEVARRAGFIPVALSR